MKVTLASHSQLSIYVPRPSYNQAGVAPLKSALVINNMEHMTSFVYEMYQNKIQTMSAKYKASIVPVEKVGIFNNFLHRYFNLLVF